MNTALKPVKTLNKKQLLEMLEDIPDDSRIYVMATASVIEMAQSVSQVEPYDVYLALSTNVQTENDGISLVADFVGE